MADSTIPENSSAGDQQSQSGSMNLLQVLVLIVFVGFVTLCLGIVFPVQMGYQLVIGWTSYITRTLPGVTISVERTTWFLVAFGLFTWGVHLGGKKWYRQKQIAESAPVWRGRWTFSLAAICFLLGLSGICVISMTHQTWWMVTGEPETFVARNFRFPFMVYSCREAARRSTSKYNLKLIGLGMHNYHEAYGQLPVGGSFSQAGQPQHSWVTRLLPYLDQAALYDQINFHQPWTSEDNRQHFQTKLNALLNPGIASDDDREYQPAHYAANSRVLNVNSGMNFKEITDGVSNTILAGEIKSNIKAWGDPTNFRDPARGINQSPHGFGGPFKGGANMLMIDGSVRFISEDIDPTILKALSTPNGGEAVGEF
ncbi:hypothetical protein Pan241w_01340 [Gimesia alba]|uniref:DUF1559 domain-containing protein n=1 Tax=Gimesia alba TaxID=2527973 RepID=A0A517R8B2_9PLAN|nr:DUF1559 domain-containing protein [Gimesia alba]QDT40081.1 hypothetical protein Pan241w_01340 [Gimesia alba]